MPNDTLLFELGCEELPPKSLNKLRLSLEGSCKSGLDDSGFNYDSIKSYATPRRLALVIENIADKQPDQNVEKRGPAVKAAFDDNGDPTKALQGFMRSCGIDDHNKLERLETDKGQWLMYRATVPGADLNDLFYAVIENALSKLPIDRRMRWGSNRFEFVRPVQWVLCLYGEQVLDLEILGFKASNVSRGHRFMGNGDFTIDHANNYEKTCSENSVIVDFDARKSLISEQLAVLSAKENGLLESDNALLEEVTSLVEWPVALSGQFEERFLDVPSEVLISAMKEHQRYFHLVDTSGKLLPKFITISNLESSDEQTVIHGNERVIRPRLSDSVFFYDQDRKTTLESKLERLKNVVFQTELGTYHEKVERIGRLASFIAEQIGVDPEAAKQAGRLAKADLVTDMVAEFPDLQGVMGGYYARHDGESEEVVAAVEQHYRPTHSGGDLPAVGVASCVALADKIDTIVGLFGIGQPPTGSRDPFALRRQSLGVIRTCVENELNLDMALCLDKAAELYGKDFETKDVKAYVIERLTNYYGDQGITSDVVDAATTANRQQGNLLKIDGIIRAIQSFRQDAVADQIITANKRVANLLKKVDVAALPRFNPELAVEKVEIALHVAMLAITPQANSDASEKLILLAQLQSPIDAFFEEILVMAEDESVRNNRLALLSELRERFLLVADFSLLQ